MKFSRILTRACLVLVLCKLASAPAQETESTKEGVTESKVDRLESALLRRFERRVHESLNHDLLGCVDCHSSTSMSPLILTGHPLEDLRRLLDGNYLSEVGPDSILGRVTSSNPERRMPKNAKAWSTKRIKKLRKFIESVKDFEKEVGSRTDEQFPRSLLAHFHDTNETQTEQTSSSTPNQFLTYRQLRGKLEAVFGKNWQRSERDLLADNIAAFGGANFTTRFNESHDPSASYLSALEVVARAAAVSAYRMRTGPFENFSRFDNNKTGIETLYQRLLFRGPTERERSQAREFLRQIESYGDAISSRDYELAFEVKVTDPETSRSSTREVPIIVQGTKLQLQQSILDQSNTSGRLGEHQQTFFRLSRPVWLNLAEPIVAQPKDSEFQESVLGTIELGPESNGEVLLHNAGTDRKVNFAGLKIRDLNGKVVKEIQCNDSRVQLEGAWTENRHDGTDYLDDGNQHKGASSVRVSLEIDQAAEYEVLIRYRTREEYASNVLVELFGKSTKEQLAAQNLTEPFTPGVAKFHFHCGDDRQPYAELDGEFQFDDESYIEISNQGTFEQVTAAAVDIVNSDEPKNNFLIDSKFAKGQEDWKAYKSPSFGSYNVRGKMLTDENKKKGKLSLRYLLADRRDHGWRPDSFYKVRVYYPGKRNHEPKVPVEVHARRSSPIVQIRAPASARTETRILLDASRSYVVHGSKLIYEWRQLTGPRVNLQRIQDNSKIEFFAPKLSAKEAAWAALCAALVRHPDFLFTRPPSIKTVQGEQRTRLQLLRIAQDLVGRPPTQDEFARLTSPESLEELISNYLSSPEFKEFYFHRIRLYLESQGTESQDEPARLWTYIATQDRPFQEILTADYTVDANWKKTTRPVHHGRTGVLTTAGFIEGKPGLPHYNYAAQVSMLFLGYVYEVPPEIVEQREGVTALGTTDPNSSCYSCHKVLTPLAFQRLQWTDNGEFRTEDESGMKIDASDRDAVPEYPFKGEGLEAFATQAVRKERFIRTIINTHVNFYFGRQMRVHEDERTLYRRLWENVHANDFRIRDLIHSIVTSPEYLGNEIQEIASNLK